MEKKNYHQNTSAPTAALDPGIDTTRASDSAGAATSVTQTTIAGFIERHSGIADSSAFSGIKSTAEAAKRLGFTSSADSRLLEFLEDFRATPHQETHFGEHYPQCFFLPWAGLHRVLETLELWCDLPEYYAGAIPPEQITWLEIFERRFEDRPMPLDFVDMVWPRHKWVSGHRDRYEAVLMIARPDEFGLRSSDCFVSPNHIREAERMAYELRHSLTGVVREFNSPFFVVAPKEAFTTLGAGKDWIGRTQTLMKVVPRPVQAPNDPLVISPTQGGCLVVAAWGEEGAEINALARELKL